MRVLLSFLAEYGLLVLVSGINQTDVSKLRGVQDRLVSAKAKVFMAGRRCRTH